MLEQGKSVRSPPLRDLSFLGKDVEWEEAKHFLIVFTFLNYVLKIICFL